MFIMPKKSPQFFVIDYFKYFLYYLLSTAIACIDCFVKQTIQAIAVERRLYTHNGLATLNTHGCQHPPRGDRLRPQVNTILNL